MVITATSGMVTVTTTLYGDVSPERAIKEFAATKHRAEQLAYSRPIARDRKLSYHEAQERFYNEDH